MQVRVVQTIVGLWMPEIMEITFFQVADNSPPQGDGDTGQRGGYQQGYRGGRSCGRTEPVRCYNCDEVGHITRDCPLQIRFLRTRSNREAMNQLIMYRIPIN